MAAFKNHYEMNEEDTMNGAEDSTLLNSNSRGFSNTSLWKQQENIMEKLPSLEDITNLLPFVVI